MNREGSFIDRLIEMITVLVLGLATVGTAWCGYQAAQWNGVQSTATSTSTDQRVEASRLFGVATQRPEGQAAAPSAPGAPGAPGAAKRVRATKPGE